MLALVGLFNILGSYIFGRAGDVLRQKYVLSGLYVARSAVIALFLFLPLTHASALAFAGAPLQPDAVAALDAAMADATATIPTDQRKLVTYHDAYAYFAVHYGFTVIGALQPSSFDEPTPKDIGDLIEQIRAEKVQAMWP